MRCPLRARCPPPPPPEPPPHPHPQPSVSCCPLGPSALCCSPWASAPRQGLPESPFGLTRAPLGAPEITPHASLLWEEASTQGSTDMATNKQCVRVSKMDVVAQSCGPTADPCYLRLMAQPLATLPTSCSSFSTHYNCHKFSQPVLRPLGPSMQPRGLGWGQGPAFLGLQVMPSGTGGEVGALEPVRSAF